VNRPLDPAGPMANPRSAMVLHQLPGIPDISETAAAPRRHRLLAFVESQRVEQFILGTIVVNAFVLGLETSPAAIAAAGGLRNALDVVALAIFVGEIGLKLIVYRWRFARDSWNLFDVAVVHSMQQVHAEDEHGTGERAEILAEIRPLRVEVAALRRDRTS